MRTIPLVLALGLISTLCFSQTTPTFGVKAGPVIRTCLLSGEDVDFFEQSAGMLLGFQVGGIVELPLSDQVTLQSGLTIITKGMKRKEVGDDDVNFNPVFLNIPFHFLFNAGELRIGGGPYLGFGMGGKITEAGQEFDVEFGSTDNDNWSALDFGLGVQASKMIDVLEVGLGIDLGLADMLPKEFRDEGLEYHIRQLSINLHAAYYFN